MNIRIMIGVRTEQKVNSKSAVSRNLERTQTLDELNGTGNQTGNGSKSQTPLHQADKQFPVDHSPKENGVAELKKLESRESITMPPISERDENTNGISSSNNSLKPELTNQKQDSSIDSQNEEDENDFLDMSWPKGDFKKQAVYVFLIGITGPLYMLIPDVRRPGREKYVVNIYWFDFSNCIL